MWHYLKLTYISVLHCFILFVHDYMIVLQIDRRTCFLIYVSLCVKLLCSLPIIPWPNVFTAILLSCM